MQSVGIRELKNRLSHYVREVRQGEVVQVTDRGEVVAELRPPVPQHELFAKYPRLLELAEQGRTRFGRPQSAGAVRADAAGAQGHHLHGAPRPRPGRELKHYAETSAVLAWVTGEPAGEPVWKLLAEAELVIASDLTFVECRRAMILPFLRISRPDPRTLSRASR